MPHLALRPFVALGKEYKPGDSVPMDELPARAASHLVSRRFVRPMDKLPAEGAGKSGKSGR